VTPVKPGKVKDYSLASTNSKGFGDRFRPDARDGGDYGDRREVCEEICGARPLVCLDETSKQLIAERRLPIPMKPGRPARCDYEYEAPRTPRIRRGGSGFTAEWLAGWFRAAFGVGPPALHVSPDAVLCALDASPDVVPVCRFAERQSLRSEGWEACSAPGPQL
jgi:hypothetical protein